MTAHFIDEGWELQKKILSFGLIADHSGESTGKALEKCIKDWGITKICTVTVDNACANVTAMSYLVRGMDDRNGTTILKWEYLHMRCGAHILNLTISDGLKELDLSIAKIRASCKYVRSSPQRLTSFKRCVEEAHITMGQMLVLDVPTRWNSTYLMLDKAEKYEKAFVRLQFDDHSYVAFVDSRRGALLIDDWNHVRVFTKFLKIFYDATLTFSASLHVTFNSFFDKWCEI